MFAGTCRFGVQCVEAHSGYELKEWRERYDYRRKKLQKANKIFGKTFVDALQDKLTLPKDEPKVLRHAIEGISCVSLIPLEMTARGKRERIVWTFEIVTKKVPGEIGYVPLWFTFISSEHAALKENCYDSLQVLHNIGLRDAELRPYFSLEYVKHLSSISDSVRTTVKTFEMVDESAQEWAHPQLHRLQKVQSGSKRGHNKYRVGVAFSTDIFGKFVQDVIFSFGREPYLRRRISVSVVPDNDSESEGDKSELEKFENMLSTSKERWDETNSEIVDLDPPEWQPDPDDRGLLERYPHPQPQTFRPSAETLTASQQLSRLNYQQRMHDLLYIEEMAQFDQIAEFNVVCSLNLTRTYLLNSTIGNSTAKYARPGECFGRMKLGSNLSEDTPAGRLILKNCSLLLICVLVDFGNLTSENDHCSN